MTLPSGVDSLEDDHSRLAVGVFFAADVEGGIHAIYWGDPHLESDRTCTWHHHEQLPIAPSALECSPVKARR